MAQGPGTDRDSPKRLGPHGTEPAESALADRNALTAEERQRKTEKLARFKETSRRWFETLSDDEKARVRKLEEVMTPRRKAAFENHLMSFLERSREVVLTELADQIRANPEQRQAFGKKIRAARKSVGIRRQSELAQQAGVNVETVSRIENGDITVSAETLARVYGVLMVDMRSPSEILLSRDRDWFLSTLDRLADADESAVSSDEYSEIRASLRSDHQVSNVNASTPTPGSDESTDVKAMASEVLASVESLLSRLPASIEADDEGHRLVVELKRDRDQLRRQLAWIERNAASSGSWHEATRRWLESVRSLMEIRTLEARHLQEDPRSNWRFIETILDPINEPDLVEAFVWVKTLRHALGDEQSKSFDVTWLEFGDEALPVPRKLATRLHRPFWLQVRSQTSQLASQTIDVVDSILGGDYLLIDRSIDTRTSIEPARLEDHRLFLVRLADEEAAELRLPSVSIRYVTYGDTHRELRIGTAPGEGTRYRLQEYEEVRDIVVGAVAAVWRI